MRPWVTKLSYLLSRANVLKSNIQLRRGPREQRINLGHVLHFARRVLHFASLSYSPRATHKLEGNCPRAKTAPPNRRRRMTVQNIG